MSKTLRIQAPQAPAAERPSVRKAPAVPTPKKRAWGWVVAIGAIVVLGFALVVVASTGSNPTAGGNDATHAEHGATSETGPMGGKVIPTPGQAGGHAEAGGVSVDGASIAMGRVPLMVTVKPTWTLRNTSASPVTLGQPKADVVKGCCPGELALDKTEVPAGGTATLTFPLQMHPGMDGPHDFAVHVPVTAAGTTSHLQLQVTGDFRD